ncbi:DEAD/DEAH box helicase [Streptococcus dysgalactiae subsp. equisimilis]|uniref:helicase-related protein n=1 Tax=Streptococcus dysgalactiae TaxID=1334 RepID=UPI001F147A6D|nr:DEAD/DEAH box helicase [Streptococcus dysgalactiae]UMY67844.1 DEAD/DEAH box helicase [Streptococcus dysgalactiae subsp. equisimilis]
MNLQDNTGFTNDQKSAIEKFSKLKVGALFMKQGSGKTRVALELINTTDSEFVLFVCPFSTKSNLLDEIKKWGLNREYEIVGYETVSASDKEYLRVMDKLKQTHKPFIVADESVFIKNDKSKTHNRMLKFRDLSEYRLILNGTPITKDEWDIYNQMEFLSFKIFNMHRHEFLSTFFKTIRFKKKGMSVREFKKLSEVNIDYLRKLIAPYIFEADLNFDKKVSEKEIFVDYSEECYERYQERKESLLNSLEYGLSIVQQFTNLAVACFDDKKRHEEIAKHLKGQVIVFCTLLSEVKNISNKIDCYVITGETKPDDRSKILSDFKNDNKPLLLTFGTGAFGLNLQFCNRIAFASLTYDYAKIDQAMSRIRRLGQERDIEYTYFTSNLGIYKMIKDNITKKQTLKQLIIDKIERGELNENSL